VIPTTASTQRFPLLTRALLSLLNQDEIVVPIVVINGSTYVPEVVESLKRRRDVRCVHLDEGGPTGARLKGRMAVDTEFFGMLDDDDEYLPGAVKIRLGALLRDQSIDVVVTNGYRRENGQDVIDFPEFSTVNSDPVGRLMDFAWLRSCGGLYRSESVSASYLDVPRSMELTYMAMRLALSKRLHFLDVPTYRWYRNSPESLSKTKFYMQGEPEAIRQMQALGPPARIERRLASKYAASLHYLSDLEMVDGNYLAAWRYHLRCLLSRYGIRYLAYTRHLFKARPLRLGQTTHETIKNERRQFQRVALQCKVTIKCENGELEGETINISLNGALLRVPVSASVRSAVQMRLSLYPGMSPVVASGSVVRMIDGNLMGIYLDSLTNVERCLLLGGILFKPIH
jgi:glycosyltransferase involved in cell wall biosynthesis